MNVEKAFEKFIADLRITDPGKITRRYKQITKTLNRKYWNSDSETANSLQAGSFGRGTATESISDLDMITALPWAVKRRIDRHDGNGQSALLQEVKNVLLGTYPSTEISGDGQVVAVKMTDFTIEVVPAFERKDGSFYYPDTQDGGSWGLTDPRSEIRAINTLNKETDGNLKRVCKMIRAWKNKEGVALPGLLIDTLVYNFFTHYKSWRNVGFDEYHELATAVFAYLGNQDPAQEYWLAPGSRQYVYRKGAFVRRAKTAHRKCREAINRNESKTAANLWRDIFGPKFPTPEQLGDRTSVAKSHFRNTEQYVEDHHQVDIRDWVTIDCEVTQSGFRPRRLSDFLRNAWPLKHGKSLRFFITGTSAHPPFEVKWKIRNIGPEAERRDMIRGQIVPVGSRKDKTEHTDFKGPHYVECYVIKNDVCVARTRIDVPISSNKPGA